MSHSNDLQAACLRELRASGGNTDEFISQLDKALLATLSSRLRITCARVVDKMNLLGHNLLPDPELTCWDKMRVAYKCSQTQDTVGLTALIFQLNAGVLELSPTPEALPTTTSGLRTFSVEEASPGVLESMRISGASGRMIERQAERVGEFLWQQELRPTWAAFVEDLRLWGYSLIDVFMDESSMDIRDPELLLHVGMSTIVSAMCVRP